MTKIFRPKTKVKLTRARANPIIRPRRYKWEARTYNPGAIFLGGRIHILYRGEAAIGYAATKDGTRIIERLTRPIFVPKERYDKNSKGYPGAEDPRLVRIGERIYMTYTQFEGDFSSIKMALTSIRTRDFYRAEISFKLSVGHIN